MVTKMEASQKNSNDVHDNDEELINWREEARGIINDVKAHVAEIEIADGLQSTESCIYLNIKTIEEQTYCVQVSSLGFRIVSNVYNTIDPGKAALPTRHDAATQQDTDTTSDQKENDESDEIFETPYALLDKISPRYVDSFGNLLLAQLLHLQNLQQMQEEFNEADEEEAEAEAAADSPKSHEES